MRNFITRLAIAAYTIIDVECSRCHLRYDAGDPGERAYHTMSGGCR